ncbi:hypothetical protein JYU34_020853 [Plutella xylostella]|uniref:Condensin complex subunit 2 n=1 Tax=Plutella xylostella TaxID=51655 RepID=A0ABQ7PS44_PLUXY|nr:hypothetical protein JYU34_020853 [Plutella xylostella]
MMLESPISSTPDLIRLRKSLGGSANTSLRRRSLIPKTPVADARLEACNDDDEERSSLLARERAVATSTPQSPRRARDTMSSSPQKEHFQGCLKLYAENKITKDNAWNLQLIDFMSSMLRRHDTRMENLQTASTVVDASARIYSFRVDAVHHDVLKMAGGLTKASHAKRGKKDDDAATQDDPGDGEPAQTQAVKKKKKRKGAVAQDPDVFNGDFDANDCIDPFFERLAATTGDVTSSNRAFNATLPIHDNTLGLILRTDEPYLEAISEEATEDIDLSDRTTLPLKLLPPFAGDRICEPFAAFSISNWDPDTEDDDNRVSNWVEENRLNLSQQALAFDVNAEVEPIPVDEAHNDLLDDEPLAGIDSDEEADVAVAACVARLPPAPAPRLTDMRPGRGDCRLEYSYSGAVVQAWAGPRHWRLRNNRASERTQSTAGGLTNTNHNKKPARSKRQLDFLNAGLAFEAGGGGEFEPAAPAKVMISRKTLATGHAWNEANFKTPVDRGLDESHFYKLYLRQSVTLRAPAAPAPAPPPPEPMLDDEPRDYDYNNENDASYCPTNVPEGEEWGPEDGAAAELPHAQPDGELGDMLEPPTKVAKIFIPYAMRAKKVDMKQLKHQTWNMLTERTPTGEKEDVQPTTFFSIYSRLPNKLSTNMKESLSVPLALLSVLHLANERGLILDKRDDLKDFDILGLIK